MQIINEKSLEENDRAINMNDSEDLIISRDSINDFKI